MADHNENGVVQTDPQRRAVSSEVGDRDDLHHGVGQIEKRGHERKKRSESKNADRLHADRHRRARFENSKHVMKPREVPQVHDRAHQIGERDSIKPSASRKPATNSLSWPSVRHREREAPPAEPDFQRLLDCEPLVSFHKPAAAELARRMPADAVGVRDAPR